jgi:hypothetical protein
MPMTACVPTRLTVDSARIDDDEVRAALDIALTRTVTQAVDVTLAGRPAGTAVTVGSPSIEWVGAGATMVSAASRDRLAADVRAAVTAALARAGIVDGVLTSVTREAREPIVERRDASRDHAWLDRYVVPSYDGGKAAVKVKRRHRGGYAGPSGEPIAPAYRLAKISEISAIDAAFNFELGQRGVTLPTSGRVGAMLSADDGTIIYLAVYDIATEKQEFSVGVKGLRRLRAKSDGTLDDVPAQVDPDDVYRFTVVPAKDVKMAFREFNRKDLIAGAKLLQPKLENQTELEYDKAISDSVDEKLDARYDAEYGKITVGRLVRLKGRGGGEWLVVYDEDNSKVIPADLDIDVFPLRRFDEEATDLPGAGAGPGAGAKGGDTKTGAKQGAGRTPGAGGDGVGGVPGGGGQEPGFVVGEPPESEPEGPGTAFIGALPGTAGPSGDVCAPWGGEPPIAALGAYRNELSALMGQIAARLEMQPCEHAGAFLLAAARMYQARAEQVGLAEVTAAGENRPAGRAGGAGGGNFGWIRFSAVATPQVQLLRHIAGTTPLIDRMHQVHLNAIAENGSLITGRWANSPVFWQLHFLEEFTPSLSQSVGTLFLMTCRVLFIQLLLASKKAIDDDLANIAKVANDFETHILPMLVDVDKLIAQRDKLRDYEFRIARAEAGMETGEGYVAPPKPARQLTQAPQNWREAADAVTDALGAKPASSAPAAKDDGAEGDIAEYKDVYYIRDGRGRWHTVAQLEDLITMARGAVESIDPLVKHIIELEDVLPRMRDPQVGVRVVLEGLLKDMQQHNEEITTKAKADVMFAFRSSNISEHIEGATVPYSRYMLRGIHLQAHHSINEFFHGDRFYALGIDYLFGVEEGYQSLKTFGELVGVVLLAVIWAPLGIAVGIALAGYHYEEAVEREHVYDALIDPDLVISRAEVEAMLFAAKLGLVLSFIPVGGKLLGALKPLVLGATIEVEEAAAAGARRAAAEAAAEAAEEAAAAALRTATKDVLEKFVTELTAGAVINKLMQLALDPVMQAMTHAHETTRPVGGNERAMSILMGRVRARMEAGAH